jgi:predicted unusual protein kinase regulating ubiquinone biosynthesis (AarF/ABC1/UbiB family)
MREFLRLSFNKRCRQIFFLVVTFALQYWWLGKRKRFLSAEQTELRYKAIYEKQAETFTARAIEMGGLLIKLGQFFSSRVDILPAEYTDELSKLQDSVQPVDSDIIMQRVVDELGPLDQVFSYFSHEPLAAASLGQVHRATLNNGDEVAVKILRPGIEDIIAIDLEALRVVLVFARRYPQITNAVDLDMVYEEFKETVTDELDYDKEGHNAERFKENFAKEKRIYIPRICWPHSTKKVLTLEYIEGIKINEYESLDKIGVDRSALAEILVTAYLQQVLIDGFFHADPHPGNILIKEDGTLVFLDFGMVGTIDQNMKASMVHLVLGAVKKDAGAVVDAFSELHFLRPHAEKSIILKSVRLMLADLYGDQVSLDNVDFNELALEFRDLIYSQPFQIPARTTFLGKAAVTVVGLCIGLDDQFDAMKVISPYIKKVFSGSTGQDKKDALGLGAVWDQVKKTFTDAVAIPERFTRFVDGLESGDLRLHPSRSFEERMLMHQSFLAGKVVAAVLSSGLMVAGTQLLNGHLFWWGVGLLTAAGISVLSLFRREHSFVLRNSYEEHKMMRPEAMAPGFKQPRLHP